MSDIEIKMSDQLWELNVEHAREILNAFLNAERIAFLSVKIDSIELDYSKNSVIRGAHYVANEIKFGRINEDQQKIWFARLGYYFGETLCRAKPGLSWSLGNQEYAFANHPVIAGFADEEEAPVITICKNMIKSVAEGRSLPTRIDNIVTSWFETSTQIE